MMRTVLAICFLIVVTPQVNGDVVIDVFESDGDVVATLSGFVDLSVTFGNIENNDIGSYEGFSPGNGGIAFSDGATDRYDMGILRPRLFWDLG